MDEEKYVWIKIILLLISFFLSVLFLVLFHRKRKEMSFVNVNVKKLYKYVGKNSFFWEKAKVYSKTRDEKEIREINNGIEKHLRFFYSTWFYVFICTGIISIIIICFYTKRHISAFWIMNFKQGNL